MDSGSTKDSERVPNRNREEPGEMGNTHEGERGREMKENTLRFYDGDPRDHAVLDERLGGSCLINTCSPYSVCESGDTVVKKRCAH